MIPARCFGGKENQWLSCKNLILYDGKYSDNCPHGYCKNKKIK